MARRALWMMCLATACTAAGERAGDTAAAQQRRGAAIYQAQCTGCHEVDGGIGVRLSATALAGYRTAGALYRYLQRAMPYSAPGILPAQAYRDVTSYLLASRNLADAERLVRESLDSVSLQGR